MHHSVSSLIKGHLMSIGGFIITHGWTGRGSSREEGNGEPVLKLFGRPL